MPPATTISERRTKIDRYLDAVLERADERPLAAVSTMDACPDRWYGQLVILSHNAIADEPRTDAILPASAAIELLRGYCRLRSELFVQLGDDFAHSLTRDPADVLLAGDYLNSAAYTALAETDCNQLEDAFNTFAGVSSSLVEAFDTGYVRSVDDYSFLDETAGSLGEGAAIIGVTLAGVNTFQRADFATLGRGFSTAYQVRRILDGDDSRDTRSIAPPQFDERELRQYGARQFREATRALNRLAGSADVEQLREFVTSGA